MIRVLELVENPVFADLKEFMTASEQVTFVFSYPMGRTLLTCLEQPEWALPERFAIGQKLLERLILLQLPDWLAGEVLDSSQIYPEQEPVGFYYLLDHFEQDYWSEAEGDKGQVLCRRFSTVFGELFAGEIESTLYPELTAYVETLPSLSAGLMELFCSYLELLPVCSQERVAVTREKPSLLARVKSWGPKILTAGKLLMGAAVLIAAVTTVPRLWQEKVVPVAEAAILWKAVYVDGESLPGEPEETQPVEPETDPEPETEQENGLVTWFWENGNPHYKGEIVNGLYEGRGMLYYANGQLAYQGDFSFGQKDGEGSLYTEAGVLLYEGGFKKDKYEGIGKMYDEKYGNLVYDGEFSSGKYNGTGLLFDPLSEFPLYAGTFRQGYYDGQGVEYDNNGAPRYEGHFLLGIYHGQGVYYDAATGAVLLSGEFRNGMLVLSDLPEETGESAEADQGGAGPEGAEPEGAEPEEAGQEKARHEEVKLEEAGTGEAEEDTTPSIAEQEGNIGNERTNTPVVVPEAG